MSISLKAQIEKFLSYDPRTGQFVWKISPRYKIEPGDIAGSPDAYGYHIIRLRGKAYKAHRLAWFISLGSWPAFRLDHKNRRRDDNRLRNLRPAPSWHNNANAKPKTNNLSGFKGVGWNKTTGKYTSRITKNGVVYYLGYFDTPEEASLTYQIAAKAMFGEYARAA